MAASGGGRVEMLVVAGAMAVFGLLMLTRLGRAAHSRDALMPLNELIEPRALPSMTVVGGEPPLRIYADRPVETYAGRGPSGGGPEYGLTLSRGPSGRWTSVLRAPAVASSGGVLTVTLVVPWRELSGRFSGVNLVVR